MPPRNSDPNRPKGRTSAYAFFVKHQREVCKEQGKSKDFTTFAKDCADAWKELGDEPKKKFLALAEEDKKRYDREMSTYVAPVDSTRGRARRKKDPNLPKRPLSAFLFFCQDRRPQVKAKNPDFKVGEMAKVMGKDWSDMTVEQRKPYEDKAEKDRARYEKEKKDYVPLVSHDDEEDEDDDEYED